MRADRLLALMMLLRRRGRMTAPAIAAELEVSVRTVLRDIEALSATGVPVYAERGRHGGFALLDGFSTDLTGLTHSEAAALFSAGSRTTSGQLGLAPALASAMAKLIAAMPREQRRTAERVSQRVLVDAAGFGRAMPTDEHIGTVQRAVFGDRRLRFGYPSRADHGTRDEPADRIPGADPAVGAERHGRDGPGGRSTIRTVDPLGLVHSAGRWYLLALHRGAERTYRVSRIRDPAILDEPAHRPPGIDLEEIWNRRRAEFRQGFDGVTVTVAVIPDRRSDVAASALAAREVRAEADEIGPARRPAERDWPRLNLDFGDAGHAAAVLWRLGPDVEVLAPPDIRALIARMATAVAGRYAVRSTED